MFKKMVIIAMICLLGIVGSGCSKENKSNDSVEEMYTWTRTEKQVASLVDRGYEIVEYDKYVITIQDGNEYANIDSYDGHIISTWK